MRVRRLGDRKDRGKVKIDHRIPPAPGNRGCGRVELSAGIVDEQVDAPWRANFFNDRLDRGTVAQIAGASHETPLQRLRQRPGIIEGLDPPPHAGDIRAQRSEEHTSELQSLMRISYAVFCLKKKTNLLTTH